MDVWQALRQQTFQRVFDAAESVGATVVIAGGAVVHFRKATDVDVFVLGQPWRPGAPTLSGQCDALVLALDGTLAPMSDAETYICTDDRGQFYRAGKADPDWSPKPIHVIGWHADHGRTTPVGLLETFDLSIHAWAIDDRGRLISCDNSTSLAEPIEIRHDTPTTPERLVKLTQRYFSEAARG